MVGLICLVLAVIYLIRRPRIAAAYPEQYPEIDGQAFRQWRTYELKSIDTFVWTLGLNFLLSLLLYVPLEGGAAEGVLPGVLMGVMAVLFFGGLIMSAIAGDKAKGLRLAHKIRLR